MSLFAELQRRNVYRAAVFYAAAGWLLVQVATQVFPLFHVAEWVMRWIVVAVVIGFPFAVLFSWFYEWTPEGLKRESEVDRSGPIAKGTGKKLDRWIIAILALAVVLLLADKFVLHKDAGEGAQLTVAAKSVAVLPFSDLSPGHDQEYFSDGMAEELLNALAKVKDLKVAGRTSSFYYKGRNEDLRAIGKALGVANVLEGSVRKQGEKVRITAQLIRSEDGFHLWSDTFDGDLVDVFELQERIARAITSKLQVLLSGEKDQRLVTVATSDPEAYALYLQATGIFNRREGAKFPQAVAALEQALKLDPNFARAHSRLAAIHGLEPIYAPDAAESSRAAVEREAALATQIDSSLAEPYAALSVALGQQGRFVEARAAIEHALALDPDDITSNFWAGVQMINTGYSGQGSAEFDRVLAIDPLLPNALLWRGIQYVYSGDIGRGETLLKRAADVGLVHVGIGLHLVYAAQGRFAEAAQQLAEGLRVLGAGLPAETPTIIAQGVYGDAAARAKALAAIDGYLATKPAHVSGVILYSLLLLGENERALAQGTPDAAGNNAVYFHFFWSPAGRTVRAMPAFKAFIARIGLVDLWDRYGAPDACRRVARGDYDCAAGGTAAP